VTRVLVVGKDGRTDCLAEALRAGGAHLYAMCDYRNRGLVRKAIQFRQGKTDDPLKVLEFAREVRAELVVIGPEEPLAAGVVDKIQEFGIPCVGPTRTLARLESSKSFTRRLLTEFEVPGNVEYRTFGSMDGLEEYMKYLGAFVIKPDGLTGGKGVKVYGEHLQSIEESLAYASSLLPSGPIVVEEKLDGEEFSLQSFCDGDTVVDALPVQDHKRAWEGDLGPNTGGMGSYSCEDHLLPFLTPEHLAAASAINQAVARALREKTKERYRGVLYGGFMLTRKGVRLLEYNARLGDPEAMNVIGLLDSNFLDVCQRIVSGGLAKEHVRFKDQASVCKYVVPKNYPANPVRGAAIDVDLLPEPSENFRIYFAAVQEEEDGRLLLTGSRALALLGIGRTVSEAEAIAETAAVKVMGPVEHRKDIGTAKLLQRRVHHIKRIMSE
jgi:phosphoribosylamine---glycine ligase